MRILRSCCLGIGVLVAGQAWADSCQMNQYAALPVEMIQGHPMVRFKVNGTDARFFPATGTLFSAMPKSAANALKLEVKPAPFRVNIGGKEAEVTSVKDLDLGGATLHNVDFVVGGPDGSYGWLGSNLLNFADLDLDLAGGHLTLFKTEQCDKTMLAYWVKGGGEYYTADLHPSHTMHDRRAYITVAVNGEHVRAMLDSQTSISQLTRGVAERAGIDLTAPEVKAGPAISGAGGKPVKTWIAPVDSLSIGTDTIRHTSLEIVDETYGEGFGDGDVGLILGVDFLYSHHLFIASNEGKAYFTYNGGRVFRYADEPDGGDKSDVVTSADGMGSRTASEYALLGEEHVARGEMNAAVADLNEATRLAPDEPAYYLSLAQAQAATKQLDAALAAANKSISLDSKNVEAFLLRAQLRLAKKEPDRAGAVADIAVATALLPAGSSQAPSIVHLYLQLGQAAAALPVLDDWIRLHDDDANLGRMLNLRCWARGLSNQMLDDALKDCRQSIRRDGESPIFLDSLGIVELRLGHYAESIAAYQKALAGQPKSAWTHYGLGLAELRSGQTDAGNADLAAARALDPTIEVVADKYGLTTTGPTATGS